MTGKLFLVLSGIAIFISLEAASIQKSALEGYAKRALNKRESVDRDEVIAALRELTEEEFNAMSEDEKIALAFLIYVFDIEPSDLQKRAIIKRYARSLMKRDDDDDFEMSRDEFVDMLKGLTEDDLEKLSDDEKLGLLFLIYLFEVEPHELEKRSVLLKSFSKRSLVKRDEDELTREDLVSLLSNLTEEDVNKLTDEEKLGLLFLVYLYDIQPEEVER